MGLKALKKFGQNYLTDKNIVDKMISTLDILPDSTVLEIGPGKGFITNQLLNTLDHLIGVEIDSRVIEQLKIDFPSLIIYEREILLNLVLMN